MRVALHPLVMLRRFILSNPTFENIGTPEDKAIEECSELIKEICKARRFGYFNFHPSEPDKINIDRILYEIVDVQKTLNALESKLLTMKYEEKEV